MSTSYSFYIRVGFQISTNELMSFFKHQAINEEEGVFHMEDRFDPKTGVKVEPVKIWDKKPKTHTETWWEIEGERFEDWEDEFITKFLEEKLGCGVDAYWQSSGHSDRWLYGFYPHPHNNKVKMGDGYKFSIHNTNMDYKEVCEMQTKLQELKEKLQAMGLNPGDAKIFVGEVSG